MKAKNDFKDEDGVKHAGMVWMIGGPRDYIPNIEVEVIELRKSYPLDKNEGIYVKDKKSGEVRLI